MSALDHHFCSEMLLDSVQPGCIWIITRVAEDLVIRTFPLLGAFGVAQPRPKRINIELLCCLVQHFHSRDLTKRNENLCTHRNRCKSTHNTQKVGTRKMGRVHLYATVIPALEMEAYNDKFRLAADKWRNKLWYILIMEYNCARKKD